MKVAICKGCGGFDAGWIAACEELNLAYEIVSPYDSDAIDAVKGATHVLWHWHQNDPADYILARSFLCSLESMGVKVFPDMATCWHFDDKLAQKYLLEAHELPLAKTWAFYSRVNALSWAKTAQYPKVFKLRAGAGAKNVKLVRSYAEAKKLIKTMFGRGIPAANVGAQVAGTVKAIKKSPLEMFKKVYRIPHYIGGILLRKMLPRQVGYCLFQEFIPGNTFDTRIIIIGDRAIGIRRMVRKNDFRASGSGMIDYDRQKIDVETVKLGFLAASKLKTQSLALDFVRGQDGKYWIVEISYGFAVEAYYECPGFWDRNIVWHDADVKPERWILEDLIK